MAFSTKVWYDAPNPLTPLSAAAMNDLETRIAAAATQADAFNLQPAVRCYNSTDIALANNTLTTLTFDTNRFDSDSQHYTSAAALTGTVAKTSGSAAIVGTSTLFTSQLSVGQLIDIPGTATERRVVTSITDDTHLTVNANLANTASGQTVTRVNSGLVARTAGVYAISGNVTFDVNATNWRGVYINVTSGTTTNTYGYDLMPAVATALTPTRLTCSPAPIKMAQWDYAELGAHQGSGGSVAVKALPAHSPEFGGFRMAAG